MRTKQHLLYERFEASEQRFQTFVRSDRECRRAILQSAGLDGGDAELVEYRPRYYGAPDFVCRLPDGRSAIIELCFELLARHAFKDFSYVLDPAAENVTAIVWVCDFAPTSVVDMIRHYATQFGLHRRITLEILVPQGGRFNAEPPVRFAFDPLLRDLRAGMPRSSNEGATVFERLTELFRSADEIDTVALARLLGVTPTWVTLHASKPKKGNAPRLACKLAPDGTRVRGNDGRFLFDLEHVSTLVSDLELRVTQTEAPGLRRLGATLPLVSARDPRIGARWMTLEAFRRETLTRRYASIKRDLGEPVAFCIGGTARGYSLLWPVERRNALRPPTAVNDNVPVTTVTYAGAQR